MNISWASPGKTRIMTINDENTKLIFDDVINKESVKHLIWEKQENEFLRAIR